nr:uncharacterized protein LOC107436429 [Parasteatoda tepidariorum]
MTHEVEETTKIITITAPTHHFPLWTHHPPKRKTIHHDVTRRTRKYTLRTIRTSTLTIHPKVTTVVEIVTPEPTVTVPVFLPSKKFTHHQKPTTVSEILITPTTSIVVHSVPPETTLTIPIPLKTPKITQHFFTTTTRKIAFTASPYTAIEDFSAPSTVIITKKPIMTTHSEILTTKTSRYPIPSKTYSITRPTELPKTFSITPTTITWTQTVDTTTVSNIHLSVPAKHHEQMIDTTKVGKLIITPTTYYVTETVPTQSTALMHIPVPSKMWSQYMIPTEVATFHFTPATIIETESLPVATTKVLVRIPTVTTKAETYPDTTLTVFFPVKSKKYVLTFEPKEPEFIHITPSTFTVTETVTPTTVETIYAPMYSKSLRQFVQQTTVKAKIIEPTTFTVTHAETLPTTSKFTFTPKLTTSCDKVTRTTTRSYHFTPPTIVKAESVKVPATLKFTRAPTTRTVRETKTPSTTVIDHIHLPTDVFFLTFPTGTTHFHTYTPKVTTKFLTFTPSTVQYQSIPMKNRFINQKINKTTTQEFIITPSTLTATASLPVPSTTMEYKTKFTRKWTDIVFTTKFATFGISPPTVTESGYLPIPETTTVIIAPLITTVTEFITMEPTETVQFKASRHHFTLSRLIEPSTIHVTPSTAVVSITVTPTTVETIHIPKSSVAWDQLLKRTTMKKIILAPPTKVITGRGPVPTTKVIKYTPVTAIFKHTYTPSTTKSFRYTATTSAYTKHLSIPSTVTFIYTPVTGTKILEKKTTVRRTVTYPIRNFTIPQPYHPTEKIIIIPPTANYSEIVTRTTRRIKVTEATTRTVHFTPSTSVVTHAKAVPTTTTVRTIHYTPSTSIVTHTVPVPSTTQKPKDFKTSHRTIHYTPSTSVVIHSKPVPSTTPCCIDDDAPGLEAPRTLNKPEPDHEADCDETCKNKRKAKRCVQEIDSIEMNKCHLGFHKVLVKIIILEESASHLEMPNSGQMQCLKHLFNRCSGNSIVIIQSILYDLFDVCIDLPIPDSYTPACQVPKSSDIEDVRTIPENDKNKKRTKRCVMKIDKKEMNKCYPGFHKALIDIIVNEKTESHLEMPSSGQMQCIQNLFDHCTGNSIVVIQSILYDIFDVCFDLPISDSFAPACDVPQSSEVEDDISDPENDEDDIRDPESNKNKKRTIRCVTKIDRKKMNKCYPGFHKALLDIIVNKKTESHLEMPSSGQMQCLKYLFDHCTGSSIVMIQSILHDIFDVCFDLPIPDSYAPACEVLQSSEVEDDTSNPEKAEDDISNPESDKNKKRTKRCVTKIDRKEMNKCYPGFHKALLDIIVNEKTESQLEMPSSGQMQCLEHLFDHCTGNSIVVIQSILHDIFDVCFDLPIPDSYAPACEVPQSSEIDDDTSDPEKVDDDASEPGSSKIKKRTKRCVKRINSKKMNKCYPEFHDALMDIIINEKTESHLEMPSSGQMQCIQHLFDHCTGSSIVNIQSILYVVCGICFDLPIPDSYTPACKVPLGSDEKDNNDPKKCVMEINGREMDKCYPGFQHALVDVIVSEKFWSDLTMPSSYKMKCARPFFRHCSGHSIVSIQAILYAVYDFCFDLPLPEHYVPACEVHKSTEQTPEDCMIPSIPSVTYITCYLVPRKTEECSEDRILAWKLKIKDCVLSSLLKHNLTVQDIIDKVSLKKLKIIVVACIKKTGDLPCRKDTYSLIKWIVEKEVIIVGQYIEQNPNYNPDEEGDGSVSAEKCVIQLQDDEMDSCYPGFHNVLMDVIVHKKNKVALEMPNSENVQCIQNQFSHCSGEDIVNIQNMLFTTFGICFKLPINSNLKPACDIHENLRKVCTKSFASSFAKKVDKCVKKKSKNLPLDEHMVKIIICVNSTSVSCAFSKWRPFQILLTKIIDIIKRSDHSGEHSGDEYNQQCFKQLTLENIKPCSRDMIALVSVLYDTGAKVEEKTMKTITQCFASVLKKCGRTFIKQFLKIVEYIANLSQMNIDSESDYLNIIATHSSYTVSQEEINVCDSVIAEVASDYEGSSEEMCLPLNGGERPSNLFVLMKNCRRSEIEKWIKRISRCVSKAAEAAGLKNPKLLHLTKIVKFLLQCVKHKENHLICRPKTLGLFKYALTSLFSTVKKITYTSHRDGCFEQFASARFNKCYPKLYRHLVILFPGSKTKDSKQKAWSCLSSSLKQCPKEAVELLFEILYTAIAQNDEQYNDYSTHDGLMTCEPDDAWANCDEQVSQNNEVSSEYMDEDSGNEMLSNEYESDDYEMDVLNLKFDDSALHETQAVHPIAKVCSKADYQLYFENLMECQNIKMSLILNRDVNECSINIIEKSLEAVTVCVLEENARIPCIFNEEWQVKDFLKDLSWLLKSNLRFRRMHCPNDMPCYGASARNISKCSDYVFSLYKESMNSLSYQRGFEVINSCVNQIWPNCSSSFSLSALPIIYIPLGINLSDYLKETGNQTCFSAKIGATTSAVCNVKHRKLATEIINDCLDRVVTKLMDLLAQMKIPLDEIHWTVDPLSICVTTHQILECQEKDLSTFKFFMNNLFNVIKRHLEKYLHIFKTDADFQAGIKCIRSFSNYKIDRCLSIMFGFISSYHDGYARVSDYPLQCVEEIFKNCGDMKTFHTLMKKSMNVPTADSNPVVPEVCFQTKHHAATLRECSIRDFEDSYSETSNCIEDDGLNYLPKGFQSILEVCTNCVLKEVFTMCYYKLQTLKDIAVKALTPIGKCLLKFDDTKEKCILEITQGVRNKCILYLHSFAFYIKKGTFMQAAESSKEFYSCIKQTVKTCPGYAHNDIFRLYKRFAGLQITSQYEEDTETTFGIS